jgi:hypothetical protein
MKILVSLIWMIVALYLAVVGWNAASVYKASSAENKEGYNYEYKSPGREVPVPLNFHTKGDVEEFKRQQRLEQGDWQGLLFSWMPRNYAPFLVPMIFGLLGGVFGSLVMVWREVSAQTPTEKLFLQPVIGLIIGALFYGMSMLVPKILASQETTPSWFSLIWLSLIGGFFAEQALNFLKGLADKFFGKAPATRRKQSARQNGTESDEEVNGPTA